MNLLLAPLTVAALIIRVAFVAVVLWALIDAAVRPTRAYALAGKWSKQGWLIVLGVGALVVCVFGGSFLGIAALIASIVYLVDVRPAVKEFRSDGSNTHMGPYGPW